MRRRVMGLRGPRVKERSTMPSPQTTSSVAPSQPNHGKISLPRPVCSHGTWRLASKNHRAVGNAICLSSPVAASPPKIVRKIPLARMVTRI